MADELASHIGESVVVFLRRKGGKSVVMRDVILQSYSSVGVMVVIRKNGNWAFVPWPLVEGIGGQTDAGSASGHPDDVLSEVEDWLAEIGNEKGAG